MSDEAWQGVVAALDAVTGHTAQRFWLRDDDAVTVTPALERLGVLAASSGMPVLLAVIPAGATAALAGWTNGRAGLTPCQHGFSHRNHAAPGERACELGGDRGDEAVLRDLSVGRAAMRDLFGEDCASVLVPPWNRIRSSLLPQLPALGYAALSTFAGGTLPATPFLPTLDCDLDIIDWRGGRRGRSDIDLCRRLVALIAASRATGAPIGILTHHLVHDDQAWRFLERLLHLLSDHPGAGFVGAPDLLLARRAR